ncbi:UNVERIFIED_CONTAM: hypothetical protein Scaly_0586100 [Sesamum calycinum]|uniref:Gag-pol polyprotein n=1 Tax=Sesamum calycinum TaxID=2727403 RepID=A0AAW2RSJ1_9LAMI
MDSGVAPTNITVNINTIPMLNGSNFKSWKENLEIVLEVMDLDLALRKDSPLALTDKNTFEQKREKERWKKSNRMCVMIMKKSILKAFRGTMSETLTKKLKISLIILKREPPFKKLQKNKTPTPPKPLPLRRSTREKRNDYIVFLQEHEVDIGMMEDDPINFHQAMECSNSQKWIDAMNEDIKSMKDNDV